MMICCAPGRHHRDGGGAERCADKK